MNSPDKKESRNEGRLVPYLFHGHWYYRVGFVNSVLKEDREIIKEYQEKLQWVN